MISRGRRHRSVRPPSLDASARSTARERVVFPFVSVFSGAGVPGEFDARARAPTSPTRWPPLRSSARSSPRICEFSRFIGCVCSVTQKSRSIREIHVEGWRRAWRRVSTSLEPWILPVPMRATPGMSRRPLSATHRDATRPTLLAVARKQTRATNLNLPRVFILRRTRLETRHPDSTARVESRAPHHGSPRNVTRD